MSELRLGLSTMLLLASLRTAGAQPSASLVLLNGKIWTVNEAQPRAEAVACLGSRIVAVGSNGEIRKWIGAGTEVLDLNGKLVLPGFNDAHVHFFSGGENLAGVQLRDAKSEDEFRKRIAEFAARQPAGRWISGGGWDHENWTPARLPTRQSIDAVTAGHPVFVNRLDGHMALANSQALQLAGITRDTPDPPGGTIVRDAAGEPTGVLKDAAMERMYRTIPEPSEDQIADAVRAAMRYAAENGVTSVQDMSAAPQILRVYQALLANGELTVRISGHQPLAAWQRLAAVGLRAGFGGEKLHIGGLKGFADGSLGSTTALFFEPYLDAPNTSGLANSEMIPESKMQKHILDADRAGLQVAVHAIGDKANHMVLGMYEEAARQNGARDRRFRIEHAQHLRMEDIPRFGQLHVIASMQPYHCIDDGRWAEKRIGPERAKGTYAFRALLDSGAVLAFGSDWDVAPMQPLIGIYAAATRRTLDGKHPNGWVPEQKITVAEAIRAYTMGSAYGSFDDKIKGSIEPGKLADMVVVSDDILSVPAVEIEKTRVETTVFDGKVIYRRGGPGKGVQ
ncbi:MAG TPA: amidohydrolase [Bryobacteraceae bacterium]|nr:amidohydrolase [Bryobacteraceae bacterium]